MSTVFRWTILVIAFLLASVLFGLSKEIFPPSLLAGFIRGVLFFLFMSFVWSATKKLGDPKGGNNN
jgi:hypothetical protein